MFLRTLFAAAVVALVAAPEAANAWSAKARVDLIIRDGPGTN
jgi:uncharacterized protein YraI